ncbi:hypothetical protein FRC09_008133 [Ceratobasidium sp. 395]|nr:hypothetical protein FRC09_008133 [Ceratobasidium sp. 395]
MEPEEPTRLLREQRMSGLLNGSLINRLRVVGHYIHTLSIGLSVLPVDWNLLLHQRQAPADIPSMYKKPFLPNLHNLFFGRGGGRRGLSEWLDITHQPNNVCDLFLLFLCPNLRAVSFVVNCLAIDPSILYARAPSLTDMRLAIAATTKDISFRGDNRDQRPTGLALNVDFIAWSARMLGQLPSWKELTDLTVNGLFLAMPDALLVVSRLPLISCFRVISVSGETWGELPSIADEPFPALKHLALERTNPKSAVALVRLTIWAPIVTRFTWTIKRGDDDESLAPCVGALVAISEALPRVRDLQVDDAGRPWNSLWSDASTGEVLSRFGLQRFMSRYVDSRTVVYDHASLLISLAGLGRQLVSLNLINFIIPLQLIPPLADAYPNLEELQCTIDVLRNFTSSLVGLYPGWEPGARNSRPAQQLCIIMKVELQLFAPVRRRVLWEPDVAACFLRSVWPNVTFHSDADLPVDRPSIEYLWKMQDWLRAEDQGDTGLRLETTGVLDPPSGSDSVSTTDSNLAEDGSELPWPSDGPGEEDGNSEESGSNSSSLLSHH